MSAVSASKAKREQKRLEREAKKAADGKSIKKTKKQAEKDAAEEEVENASEKIAKLKLQTDEHGLSDRVTTGVLTSLVTSRDIKITSLSLLFHGKVLIQDSTLELNYGRRYGLLGENGCGKSTLLKSIAARELPIPEHIDIYLLNEPAEPTDFSALEYVVKEAEHEMKRLEDLVEDLIIKEGPECPQLEGIYEKIDEMDPATFESRAAIILTGLGFNSVTIKKKTRDMSGGWRMRVALAKALFVKPTLLLLDDPTAHLDLAACVWLEEYLKRFDRTLILVSHSQDFLNGVCTNMIDMRLKLLTMYGGNYDSYVKTRAELETNQMKQYAKQQEEIAHIKKFIASAGTYANLVKQAKSRQKILDKMEADGLIQPVVPDRVFSFRFPEVEKLPPPVLAFDDMSFSYSGKDEDNLYEHLDIGIDMDSRVALVGPNGVGKSTLLNLFQGKLTPQKGRVIKHTHIKLGVYSQHSADQLDLTQTPLEFVREKFANISQDYQYWRGQLGRYGLSGEAQTAQMATLSEGQRSRVVFALLALEAPNLILLDEPTNGLDLSTIDSLAEAINAFNGGVVVVSHDFRLLDKVAKDIFVIENKTATRWDGSILDYKKSLAEKVVL
ncbi:ARB1 [Candida oxycetoniae]|uniref:ARB1 n=1 Tax=Candida oxycetoniae TaxID=497107 RepID=A0AAI9WYM1_9ASCO|nr:ARB1 [Candida oxycetoniae]KAI3405287.1 ARB1 [Candida oxycetoniae]